MMTEFDHSAWCQQLPDKNIFLLQYAANHTNTIIQ